MTKYRLLPTATRRIDSIYAYTLETHGEAQADKYLEGMFELFEKISKRNYPWRQIPKSFGVEGWYAPYQHHFVFWKLRDDGEIAFISVLHKRMDQSRRLREDER